MKYSLINKPVSVKLWMVIGVAVILIVGIIAGFYTGMKIGSAHKNQERKQVPETEIKKTAKPTLQGDFSGKLFKGADKTILSELNKFNWKKAFRMDPEDFLTHEVVLIKEFPAAKGFNRLLLVIVFTNSSRNDCHGCLGRNSLFEFELKGKVWILNRKAYAFSPGDEWGLSPGDLEIVSLGPPRQYGILVMTSFVSMGYAHETRYLYTFINDKMKEIFSFISSNSNAEAGLDNADVYEYTTEMKLVKGKGKFFDIVLSSEGVFGHHESDNGKRFVFNGSIYIEKIK
jgi:hypothetical protein